MAKSSNIVKYWSKKLKNFEKTIEFQNIGILTLYKVIGKQIPQKRQTPWAR